MGDSLPGQMYRNSPCMVMDVGARGGFHLMPALQEYMEVHAIEPDPVSAGLLRSSADARRFRKYTVHEIALGVEGKVQLKTTARGSMSSLLEPDNREFTIAHGAMKNAPAWAANMQVMQEQEVESRSLAAFCKENISGFIDFMKLDTQGSELEILRGGMELLKAGRVGVICTEVSFHPLYKDQGVFSDVDLFLRNCGFRFVDCRFYHDVAERENEFSAGDEMHERPKMTTTGDAWYVYDLVEHSKTAMESRQRAAIILAAQGFFSEATYLLADSIPVTARNNLFRYVSRTNNGTRFKQFLKRWTPPAVLQWRAKRRS